uniref:Secreted protein n=1 Tax=Macrostomum lignano TaxID=282301 RepID=A0A1I8FB04_9PLAT
SSTDNLGAGVASSLEGTAVKLGRPPPDQAFGRNARRPLSRSGHCQAALWPAALEMKARTRPHLRVTFCWWAAAAFAAAAATAEQHAAGQDQADNEQDANGDEDGVAKHASCVATRSLRDRTGMSAAVEFT